MTIISDSYKVVIGGPLAKYPQKKGWSMKQNLVLIKLACLCQCLDENLTIDFFIGDTCSVSMAKKVNKALLEKKRKIVHLYISFSLITSIRGPETFIKSM